MQRGNAPAWGAIGATAGFIALTCWWLTQDRSIPIWDAGDHLRTALEFHDMLAAGNLLGPLTQHSVYPPLTQLVGAIAAFVGGVSVAAPIIGENLVFVSLLALGCYQTGRLAFGPLAGMFAVLFVLASPLVISLFHVFLLDAPVAALVAVSVWLIIESQDFSRVGVSAVAGLAVGLGMNVKVQFAPFVVGLILVVLLHGGWRNWRGFAAFALVALAVGLPWYVVHAGELGRLLELASSGYGTTPADVPPTFSIDNITWYFWSVLNSQLWVPLFVLAVGGSLYTLVTVVRERGAHVPRLELTAGAFTAWVAITFVTPKHDVRYGVPLIGFIAVLATGWLVRLPSRARIAMTALLVLGVCANTLGLNFGIGPQVIAHPDWLPGGDEIVLASTTGFLVSAPSRDGDVPGLLDALRREGLSGVDWSYQQSQLADFSWEGLEPLARIANLTAGLTRTLEFSNSPSIATLVHESVTSSDPAPCTRLSDGTGVWVVRYDSLARRLAFYCPTHRPHFYGPTATG
jgi:4-amino-4-deoxy-L-arabinose transferase-like glycosyltransferase